MRGRRKRYLINKHIQLSFLCIFMAIILPISLVLGFMLYSVHTDLNNTLFLITKTSTDSANKEAALSLKTLQEQIVRDRHTSLFTLLVLILLYCLVIFVWGVYLTHRIAGPVYRITQGLRQAAEGNLKQRLILRKHDWLKETADAFNALMEYLEKK